MHLASFSLPVGEVVVILEDAKGIDPQVAYSNSTTDVNGVPESLR